jgi:nitrite reductase (NADH) large subunit
VLYGDVSDGNWYFDLIQQQQDITPLRPLLMFGQALATQPTSARQQDDSHALTSATDLQIS